MTLQSCVRFVVTGLLASASASLSVAAAQAQPEKPPLLSTVPSPPSGATPVPADMSGQPLQVGDLPPGVLVVRVIRRTFAENVARERVRIQVGPDARSLEAVTDESGRARFDGLRIGDPVLVSASVDGEALGSGNFTIPAEGGVRMLLVAGVGAGSPGGAAPMAVTDSAPPSQPVPQPGSTPSKIVLDAASVAIALFAIAALAILWPLRPRRANRTSATSESGSH